MAYMDHTFGVEIECYLPDGGNSSELATAITSRLSGAGIEGIGAVCRYEDYGHMVRPYWKLVTDRSLGDMDRGRELVSPVLRGEAGLKAIAAAMGALDDYGCTTSKKCGLHVHVGVPNAGIAFFRELFKAYAFFESAIDHFMPASRRESVNVYCRSVKRALPTLDRAGTLDQLIRVMHPGGPHDPMARYYKLNLTAFRKYKTVEFRQHSATLDAKKAVNWTALCLRMVDAAVDGKSVMSNGASETRVTNRARAGSKSHAVGEMMLRPEGVTSREAMAAMGWPSISLPQQARACGILFTTERRGHEVRYFAARQVDPAVPAATPATLDGLMDFLGCTDDERGYFRARTTNLTGMVTWSA